MDYKDIHIDFAVVDTDDPSFLRIDDTSYWGVIKDKPSVIDIKVPGFPDYVRNIFFKGEIVTFNSTSLNINCPTEGCEKVEFMELPDGIYEIVLKGSPSTYQKKKHHLRTTKFDRRLDELIIEVYKECNGCKNKIEGIYEIEFLKLSAEANIRQGDCKTAQEAFFRAQKLLNKLTNCENCK